MNLPSRPEIHQTVACGSPREANDPPDTRPDLHEGFEAFGLGILEGRQLVHNDCVEVKGDSTFFDKPLDVFPVDQVDICRPLQGSYPLCLSADGDRVSQIA